MIKLHISVHHKGAFEKEFSDTEVLLCQNDVKWFFPTSIHKFFQKDTRGLSKMYRVSIKEWILNLAGPDGKMETALIRDLERCVSDLERHGWKNPHEKL